MHLESCGYNLKCTCLDPITEVSSTQALLTGMILFSDCTASVNLEMGMPCGDEAFKRLACSVSVIISALYVHICTGVYCIAIYVFFSEDSFAHFTFQMLLHFLKLTWHLVFRW